MHEKFSIWSRPAFCTCSSLQYRRSIPSQLYEDRRKPWNLEGSIRSEVNIARLRLFCMLIQEVDPPGLLSVVYTGTVIECVRTLPRVRQTQFRWLV